MAFVFDDFNACVIPENVVFKRADESIINLTPAGNLAQYQRAHASDNGLLKEGGHKFVLLVLKDKREGFGGLRNDPFRNDPAFLPRQRRVDQLCKLAGAEDAGESAHARALLLTEDHFVKTFEPVANVLVV